MITRRRLIYVHGYDPMGPSGYYGLFGSQIRKATSVWGMTADVGPLTLESRDIASWTVTCRGPNWQVSTQYDFIRWENIISKYTGQPIVRQILRAMAWMVDDLLTGTTARTFRANWKFGVHHLVLQLLMVGWVAISLAAGIFIEWALRRGLDWHPVVALVAGAIQSIVVFVALRPLAERWFVIRINNHWPFLREFGRGQATDFDRPIEVGAQRLKQAAAANDADEIVLVGHSGGAPLVPCIVKRALELDPELGRRGPRVVVMTLGSITPCVAFHPSAHRMREAVRRIAVEPSIAWIECQSHMDAMNFWNFDPVTGIGVDAGAQRCNPLVWKVRFYDGPSHGSYRKLRFRDMLSHDFFMLIRLSFFRVHFRYIMANDGRSPYDYVMLVCGPVPVEDWAKRKRGVNAEFAIDGTYRATRRVAA